MQRKNLRLFPWLTLPWLLLLMHCGEGSSDQASDQMPGSVAGHVADRALVLTEEQAEAMEEKLEAYQEATGARYLLYTEPRLPGTLDAMSKRLEEITALGMPGLNNGAIILLARDERQVKIEVNQGFDWQVPQPVLGEIFQKMVARYLRDNRYYEGFNFVFDTLQSITSQVPWQVRYQSLSEVQSAGAAAVDQIVRFDATVLAAKGGLIEGRQFSPEYVVQVRGSTGPQAELRYTLSMAQALELLTQEGRQSEVFARVRAVEPALTLELLGVR